MATKTKGKAMTITDELDLLGDPVEVRLDYTWVRPMPATRIDPSDGGPFVDALYIVDKEVDPDDYPNITQHMCRHAWTCYWEDRYGE